MEAGSGLSENIEQRLLRKDLEAFGFGGAAQLLIQSGERRALPNGQLEVQSEDQ